MESASRDPDISHNSNCFERLAAGNSNQEIIRARQLSYMDYLMDMPSLSSPLLKSQVFSSAVRLGCGSDRFSDTDILGTAGSLADVFSSSQGCNF
jgi:hypothetical protein